MLQFTEKQQRTTANNKGQKPGQPDLHSHPQPPAPTSRASELAMQRQAIDKLKGMHPQNWLHISKDRKEKLVQMVLDGAKKKDIEQAFKR